MNNAIQTGVLVMFAKNYTRGRDMESFRTGERGTVASMDGPETAMVRMQLDGFVYLIPTCVLAVVPKSGLQPLRTASHAVKQWLSNKGVVPADVSGWELDADHHVTVYLRNGDALYWMPRQRKTPIADPR